MPASIEGFNDEAIKKRYKELLHIWLKSWDVFLAAKIHWMSSKAVHGVLR